VVKDKLRREREEARLMDLDALEEEMDDWKELTRERKRMRLETAGGKKATNKAEISVFDL
jgi:hypothetical protein